jgi:hypothetical protein
MTLYTPAFLEAVTGDTPITYHAQTYRQLVTALVPIPGVVGPGDLAVTQRAAGTNRSVDVAAGQCFIQGGSVANQGTYQCLSDAVVNVPIVTNTSGSARTDLIVAQIYDRQADGGTQYGWNIVALAGTTTAPTSSIPLAQVTVANNFTSVVNANISDVRQRASSSGVNWKRLPYNGSWGDAGGSYPVGQYTQLANGLVLLRGMVKRSGGTVSAETICTLPSGFRPAVQQYGFPSWQNNSSGDQIVRLDVQTTGAITFVPENGGSALNWLSVNNIQFYADGS